jgi:alpha-galactosidase
MKVKLALTLCLLGGLNCSVAYSQTQPQAITPPMGWNSWNHFHRNVTEADVRAAADVIVKSGMRDAGYLYVNIDDTWEGERDAQGIIHSNEKFPDMKALADYVHAKGLKLGIYSSPGPKTCAGYEGSYNHEEQDAKTYAEWGVDFLKYDLCSFRKIMADQTAGDPQKQKEMMRAAYKKMEQALQATGRPIVYSLCQYGLGSVWQWGPSVEANLWRTTGDISDTYERMSSIGFSQVGLSKYAAPGHWNDPDMLEVGNGGMTADEYRTHMSLWVLLAAPLLAGNDLSKMTAETLSILTNKDAIAIDQDSLGKQGDRAWAEGASEIWTKPLSDGKIAIGLFNRSDSPARIPLQTRLLGLSSTATFQDVWKGTNITVHDSQIFEVPTHGAVLLKTL